MAISLIGDPVFGDNGDSGGNTLAMSVSGISGIAAGHRLHALIGWSDDSDPKSITGVATGWDTVNAYVEPYAPDEPAGASIPACALFTKVATTGDLSGSHTWTYSSSSLGPIGFIFATSGADAANPTVVTNTAAPGTGTTITCNSITTTVDGELVVFVGMFGFDDVQTIGTGPGTWRGGVENSNAIDQNKVSLGLASFIKSPAGSSGTQTFTVGGSAQHWGGLTFRIPPTAVSAGGILLPSPARRMQHMLVR